MLKIKDNVDLKELEKFGFKEREYFYPLYCRNILACGVRKSNRKIYRYMYTLDGADYNTFDIFDVLFDLIQAGLVEKVGELNDRKE